MLNINYNGADLSVKLEEFALPSVAITLLSSEFIYIGYYKPITNIYIELANSVLSLSNIKLEYDTITGLVEVDNLIDRTSGLGNSGRVSWEIGNDRQVMSTRGNKTLYWYKLSVNIGTVEMSYVGINVLFSDDTDLEEEYPGILNNLPEGKTSFVNFHASARKDIVQSLRKRYDASTKRLTQFDLLNNEEVGQASKYLALSKIFNHLSDAPGDKWSEKSKDFYLSHSNYLSNVEITIDTNDNGVVDEEEKTAVQFARLARV